MRRRVTASLLALLLVSVAGGALPAWADDVSPEDVAAAEEAAGRALDELSLARSKLAEAERLHDNLTSSLAGIASRETEAGVAAEAEATAVRLRITRMYMSADRPDLLLAAVADVAEFFTRLAYLGAVADRDLDAINRFFALIDDLAGLRDAAEERLGDLAAQVAGLELVVVSGEAAAAEASARLTEVRRAWEAQEAARRAALEEEIRRQEEALRQEQTAAAATTTTTMAAPVTTTTTVPAGDGGGYGYDPSLGVEQWRQLVTEIFARWGLDREKCGPNGCLGPHIDDALTIMWCESRGVPFAVNPNSGTTGLFQHRPVFWSDRVARVQAHPESGGSFPSDASPFNPAHNIEVAALLIWESRETLIGILSFTGPWDDGPQPFGHWDGTARYCADPPLVWP